MRDVHARLPLLGATAVALSMLLACGSGGEGDDGGPAGGDGGAGDGNDDGNGDGADDGNDGGSGGPDSGNDSGNDGTTSGGASNTASDGGSVSATGPGSASTTDSGTDSGTSVGSESSSSSGVLVCGVDTNEPNDDEDAAFFLGALSDDDADAGSIAGELDGFFDADWFTYDGSDDLFSVVDPTVDVTAESDLTLCMYAECVAGLAGTSVTCPAGTNDDVSVLGRPGCCETDATGFTLEIGCPGASDDATISFFVEAQADECVMYTLDYHY